MFRYAELRMCQPRERVAGLWMLRRDPVRGGRRSRPRQGPAGAGGLGATAPIGVRRAGESGACPSPSKRVAQGSPEGAEPLSGRYLTE